MNTDTAVVHEGWYISSPKNLVAYDKRERDIKD